MDGVCVRYSHTYRMHAFMYTCIVHTGRHTQLKTASQQPIELSSYRTYNRCHTNQPFQSIRYQSVRPAPCAHTQTAATPKSKGGQVGALCRVSKRTQVIHRSIDSSSPLIHTPIPQFPTLHPLPPPFGSLTGAEIVGSVNVHTGRHTQAAANRAIVRTTDVIRPSPCHAIQYNHAPYALAHTAINQSGPPPLSLCVQTYRQLPRQKSKAGGQVLSVCVYVWPLPMHTTDRQCIAHYVCMYVCMSVCMYTSSIHNANMSAVQRLLIDRGRQAVRQTDRQSEKTYPTAPIACRPPITLQSTIGGDV
mmetsp:Transcript_6834/g.16606  ORF Transcript_6834/g.16606 Transcript_6834/m.16606 type:complete len:304 (-) Transcript_6834:1117-2028(-)